METITDPIVSVVVPVYNGENYLETCLDSILAQTLEGFELICVDNGSTDDTAKILSAYEQKDKRIKVITTGRSNCGAARNEGMAVARGRYLSFLDADDFFDPDLLKDSVDILERDQSDILVFAANQFNSEDGSLLYMPWSMQKENLPDHCPFSPLEMKDRLFNSFQNWVWNKVFRRDFVNKHDLAFQSIERNEDVSFVSTALALAEKISVTDKAYVNYRIGTEKSLQDTLNKAPTAWVDAYTELRRRLEAANVYSIYERSFLNKTMLTMMWVLNHCREDEEAYAYLYLMAKYEGDRRFGFSKHERDYYFEEKSYDNYHRIKDTVTSGPFQKYKKAIEIKEGIIADKIGELKAKERIIADKDEELKAKERIIADKDEELKAKERIIADKAGELKTKEGIIADKDEELKAKERIIADKDGELRAREGIIADKDEELKAKEGIIADKDKQIKKKSDMLNRVCQSSSFKIGRIITFIPRKLRDMYLRFVKRIYHK